MDVGIHGERPAELYYSVEEAYEIGFEGRPSSFEEGEELQKKSFAERVKRCDSLDETTYIIDKFLRVTLKEKNRDEKVRVWKKIYSDTRMGTLSMFVAAPLFFFSVGVSHFDKSNNSVRIATILLMPCLFLLGGSLGIKAVMKDKKEVENWMNASVDPFLEYRREGFDQGLYTLYLKDARKGGEFYRSLFSKEELQGLYERFCSEFSGELFQEDRERLAKYAGVSPTSKGSSEEGSSRLSVEDPESFVPFDADFGDGE